MIGVPPNSFYEAQLRDNDAQIVKALDEIREVLPVQAAMIRLQLDNLTFELQRLRMEAVRLERNLINMAMKLP